MFKKLLLVLVLLLVGGLGLVYFLGSNALNTGVRKGVETFGPRVTQTDVRLDAVDLSVLSGAGTLKGLYVGNPEGYRSENILGLGQIDLEVDTGSVFSDKIIIDTIHIRQPEISYEKTLRSSNVKDLLANIESFTGPAGETPPTDSAGQGPKKQVVIRKLIIEDGTVFVGLMGTGSKVTLPRIEMEDIGAGDPVSLADATQLVFDRVVQAIGPAIADAGQLVQEGGEMVLETAKERGQKAIDSAKDKADKAAKEAI